MKIKYDNKRMTFDNDLQEELIRPWIKEAGRLPGCNWYLYFKRGQGKEHGEIMIARDAPDDFELADGRTLRGDSNQIFNFIREILRTTPVLSPEC